MPCLCDQQLPPPSSLQQEQRPWRAPPFIVDLRDLSGTDEALVALMVAHLVETSAKRALNLTDPTAVCFALAGWFAPTDITRLVDHVLERVRPAEEERAGVGDLLGAAALFLLLPAAAIATFIPDQAMAATSDDIATRGVWGAWAIAVLIVLGILWALFPVKDDPPVWREDVEDQDKDQRAPRAPHV